jgi:hypothetical protein
MMMAIQMKLTKKVYTSTLQICDSPKPSASPIHFLILSKFCLLPCDFPHADLEIDADDSNTVFTEI